MQANKHEEPPQQTNAGLTSGLKSRALKQLPVIEEQHPQLHAQRPCERDRFGIRYATVAGFDFGDRVFGASPPAPCAARRQISLPQPRVAPCLGEMRADDIFRLAVSRRHLPFSEGPYPVAGLD